MLSVLLMLSAVVGVGNTMDSLGRSRCVLGWRRKVFGRKKGRVRQETQQNGFRVLRARSPYVNKIGSGPRPVSTSSLMTMI